MTGGQVVPVSFLLPPHHRGLQSNGLLTVVLDAELGGLVVVIELHPQRRDAEAAGLYGTSQQHRQQNNQQTRARGQVKPGSVSGHC